MRQFDDLKRPDLLSAPQARPSVSAILSNLFARYGRLLSTHQIGALLFSSVLICCLFFPTLSLYFSPDGPASQVARRGRGSMIWELDGIKRQGVINSEEEVCWDRLAHYYNAGTTAQRATVVRMEQILIAPSSSANEGALSRRTLHQTLRLQMEISRRVLEGQIPGLTCIKSRESPHACAVSSPSNFWSTETQLLDDLDVHHTLSLLTVNATLFPLPLTLSNTLVGAGRDKAGTVKGAHYLALTFYLHDMSADVILEGIGSAVEEQARLDAKRAWRVMLRDIVAGRGWPEEKTQMGKVGDGRGSGRRVILKYLPNLPTQSNPRLLEDVIFGISYLAVLLYIVAKLRGQNQIYSKWGLAFAGLVELTATGIISISICWLLGLGVALVPWKLMPFLVTVLGTDNMFILIKAIAGTDISLSVPTRVATGLRSVGLYTTLTLAVELCLAIALMKIISIEVIREVIVFTSVALVVDYCMELTFFTTILSIDIQRLELADLLDQGHALQRSGSSDETPPASNISAAPLPNSILARAIGVLKDRAARTLAFTVLFVIDALLYTAYGSDHFLPAFCSETALAKERPLLGPSLASEFGTSSGWGRRGALVEGESVREGAGQVFWQLINPANSTSVHVYVEPVSVVQFFEDAIAAPESVGSTIVATPWWQELLSVVAPIAMTVLVLYFVLRYLLQGADLIEEERLGKGSRQSRKSDEDAQVKVTTLRGEHQGDVELLASSRDMLASWSGMEHHVAIWKKLPSLSTPFASTRLHIPPTSGSLTLLALDDDSNYCVAASKSGTIIVWDLEQAITRVLNPSTSSASPVVHLLFAPCRSSTTFAPPALASDTLPYFFTCHADGSVLRWSCNAVTTPVQALFPPSPTPEGRLETRLLSLHRTKSVAEHLYTRATSAGTLEVYEWSNAATEWVCLFDEQVTIPSDPVTSLAASCMLPGGGQVLAVGTLAGVVSLYDLVGKQRVGTVAEMEAPIVKIRMGETEDVACSVCGGTGRGALMIVTATRHLASVYRHTTSSNSTLSETTCSCSRYSYFDRVTTGPASRHSAVRTTSKKLRRSSRARDAAGSVTPLLSGRSARSIDSALSTGSSFTSTSSSPAADSPGHHSHDGDNSIPSPGALQSRRGEMTVRIDERGDWELLDQRILGVRRRQLRQDDVAGTDLAPREQSTLIWDVWAVDLSSRGVKELLEQTTELQLDPPQVSSRPWSGKIGRGSTPLQDQHFPAPRDTSLARRHEDIPLPFSRARPGVMALCGESLSLVVGLGNAIAILTPLPEAKTATGKRGVPLERGSTMSKDA